MAAGSRKVGRSARRVGLLRTPEEGSRPAIERTAVRTRAAHRFARAEGQDIRAFLSDTYRRRHHLAIVDSHRGRRLGEVDPVEAVVAVKVSEATTLDEALAFLRPEEQAVALGTPALFERLSSLSAGRAVA
jgi:membrane glycosyltransferase